MSAKTPVLVLFGGQSAEHEVSIITGLQVAEQIDRNQFDVYVVYLDQSGIFRYQPGLVKRKQFSAKSNNIVSFGRDDKGSYFLTSSALRNNKQYVEAAYLAFHGGIGENGGMQGFMEALEIPFTSVSSEGAVLTMNKTLTKMMLKESSLPVAPGVAVLSANIQTNITAVINSTLTQLSLPVIIKPAHSGSSIGINVAKNNAELEKYLHAAALIDSEVVVEQYFNPIVEYNCSVKKVNGQIITSEIEKPKSKDEILSFADKYQRGGKKSGGDGMASLQRELPAKISDKLRDQIKETAKMAYLACRCKGLVRIDFMTHQDNLYITEINPIPGSVAFYLWEASGISFKEQITEAIEQAVIDYRTAKSLRLMHKSDIVEKFIRQ